MEAKKANDYKFDISHLNLHYGDFHALKDVNMKIEANKIHCIYRTFRMWKIYISEDTEPYE